MSKPRRFRVLVTDKICDRFFARDDSSYTSVAFNPRNRTDEHKRHAAPEVYVSPVVKAEVVHKDGVPGLVHVSVHLVVNCDSPPAARSRTRRVASINVSGRSIQRYRLEQKRIVGFSLHLNG